MPVNAREGFRISVFIVVRCPAASTDPLHSGGAGVLPVMIDADKEPERPGPPAGAGRMMSAAARRQQQDLLPGAVG